MPSDFSFRFSFVHTFLFLIAYIVLSLICIGIGLMLETMPDFSRGLIFGLGLGLSLPLLLLSPKKEVDITSLPELSENVKSICDGPDASLIEAVKAYREETGASLFEATAVLKAYMKKKPNDE